MCSSRFLRLCITLQISNHSVTNGYISNHSDIVKLKCSKMCCWRGTAPAKSCLGEFFRSGSPQYFSTDDIIHEIKDESPYLIPCLTSLYNFKTYLGISKEKCRSTLNIWPHLSSKPHLLMYIINTTLPPHRLLI